MFFTFIVVGSVFFGSPATVVESPLLYEATSAIPGVALFAILYLRGGIENRVWRTVFPKWLLIVAPLLVLLANYFGRTVSEVAGNIELLNTIAVCFLVGVGEEFMFRGYLHRLCAQWSLAVALIVPSVFFGLCHFQYGLVQVCVTCVVGFSFSLARIGGLNLFVLALIHGAINLPATLPNAAAPFLPILSIIALSYSCILSIAFVAFPCHWSNKTRLDKG